MNALALTAPSVAGTGTGRNRMRAVLRAPFDARAWRATLYVIVSALYAVPGFVLVVVSTVVGLGLAVTLLGLPLLATGGAAAIRLGGADRRLARRLLGDEIAGARPRPRDRGMSGWLRARLADPVAWRARFYLLLKLPLALASLYAAFVVYFVGAVLTVYPLWWAMAPSSPSAARGPTGVLAIGALVGHGSDRVTARSDHRLILQVGTVQLDRWPLVAVACLVGVLGLLFAPWLAWAAARVAVALMRSLLGTTRGSQRVERLEAARSVVAEDAAATLRRIERDLHDGTQAQLVALAMKLGAARDRLQHQPAADPATTELIVTAHAQAKDALDELRNIARGIHPPALDVGLEAALETLVSRSSVPATLRVSVGSRPSDAVATIAYYAVAELLTNVAKHAEASHAAVEATEDAGVLILTVADDGRGRADPDRDGTGLAGLSTRLGAVDGSLAVVSPSGGPTLVTVRLPVRM